MIALLDQGMELLSDIARLGMSFWGFVVLIQAANTKDYPKKTWGLVLLIAAAVATKHNIEVLCR